MFIKTIQDDANNHYFVSFSEHGDRPVDFEVTRILYKTWAANIAAQIIVKEMHAA